MITAMASHVLAILTKVRAIPIEGQANMTRIPAPQPKVSSAEGREPGCQVNGPQGARQVLQEGGQESDAVFGRTLPSD